MANCVVASNRGPVEHRVDAAGTLTERWSAGGLSTMLLGSVGGPGTAWVVATASEADRHAAPTTEDGSSYEQHITLPNGTVLLRTIVVGEALYNNYYGQVANETIWFLHHHMFDTKSEEGRVGKGSEAREGRKQYKRCESQHSR